MRRSGLKETSIPHRQRLGRIRVGLKPSDGRVNLVYSIAPEGPTDYVSTMGAKLGPPRVHELWDGKVTFLAAENSSIIFQGHGLRMITTSPIAPPCSLRSYGPWGQEQAPEEAAENDRWLAAVSPYTKQKALVKMREDLMAGKMVRKHMLV